MSTAVIYSGQARTFDLCYPTHRWQVFRHYEPDIHFFVSICDDADAPKMELLREHYKNVHIERVKDPETDVPSVRFGLHAPYANAAGHKQLMMQHIGNQRAWEFANKVSDGRRLDTIIRIRTDIFFHRFIKPPNPDAFTSLCPWWGKFGGVNDRFAVMGAAAASCYFSMAEHIEELLLKGCPFHPETLVYESMMLGKINVSNTLLTSFSTVRKDGSTRPPEISMEDLAELI